MRPGRDITAIAMKVLAFFPLAYLAGVQGFAMFAPYAATFMVIALVLRRSRQTRELRAVPVTTSHP